MTIQHLLSKMWWQVIFLYIFYIRVPLQGYDVLVADYGFDILWENNCYFAKITQNNNLNNVDHFYYIGMNKHFGYIGKTSLS